MPGPYMQPMPYPPGMPPPNGMFCPLLMDMFIMFITIESSNVLPCYGADATYVQTFHSIFFSFVLIYTNQLPKPICHLRRKVGMRHRHLMVPAIGLQCRLPRFQLPPTHTTTKAHKVCCTFIFV